MDIARQYKLRRLPERRDALRIEPDPRSARPLHVRPGEDILDRLIEGVGGDVVSWADPLCEGPLRPWKTKLDRKRDRAGYLATRFHLSYGEVLRHLGMADNALDDADLYREVVLWFEHDLYDQAILVFLLTRLEPSIDAGRVSMVSIDRHPSVDRFIGLGQLGAEQLAALYPTRTPVTSVQVKAAARVWRAMRKPDPMTLDRLSRQDLPGLPFLSSALRRYLAEFPSVENGLGRTEQLALEAIAGGAGTAGAAFRTVQEREVAPYQGDSMFFASLRGMAEGPWPLLDLAKPGPPLPKVRDDRLRASPLRLTVAGEAVLAGREDWFRLNGASRWIGGAHLIGPEPAWRYDAARERLRSFAT